MKNFYSFLLTGVIASALIMGCGDKEGDGAGEVETTDDPVELADNIMNDYLEMWDELHDLMKNEDDIKVIKEKVIAMREDMIAKMVKYGAMKKEMSDADKQKVNSQQMTRYYDLDKKKFEEVEKKRQELAKEDSELGHYISDLNIITQYSDYELLKKQEPKEAERLGIK